MAAGEGSGVPLLLGVGNPGNCGFEGRPTGTGFLVGCEVGGRGGNGIYLAVSAATKMAS